MSGGFLDGQLGRSQLNRVSVGNDLVYHNWWKRYPPSEVWVAEASVFEDGSVAGGRPHFSASRLLDFGECSRVVPMGLHRQ